MHKSFSMQQLVSQLVSRPMALKLVTNGLAIGFLMSTNFFTTVAQAMDPSEFRVEALNPESPQYGKCENQVPAVLDQIPGESALSELMTPSLWLNRDLIAARGRFSDKLLEKWMVCPSSNSDRGRIDLVVNGQLWGLLDYFERYELLQQFGNGSDIPDQRFKSGYNLRIFTKQGGDSLGSYTCNVNPIVSVPIVNLNDVTRDSQKISSRRCRIEIRDANNGLGVRAPL
jgi:hypothetical protein